MTYLSASGKLIFRLVVHFPNSATHPCVPPGARCSRGGFLSATLATFRPLAAVPLAVTYTSLHRPLRGTPRCALGTGRGNTSGHRTDTRP
jgi:hypothetical protein